MRSMVLATVFVASIAHANGRPPLTNGVHFQANDPHSIYIASTFGLLVSHDDGCTFNWLCEANIGYGGMFDPHYAVATDGAIFATTYTGLRVSRDGGCSFTTAGFSNTYVDALAIGPTGEVWIATSDSTKANDLYRSTDNGVEFTPRNVGSPAMLFNSVAIAPSDAQRIYATGYTVAGAGSGSSSTPTAALYTSSNGGDSWTPSPLANVTYGGFPQLRVMTVDPSDPLVIYVVSEIGANPPNGDRVYRSSDGGMTLTEVLLTDEKVSDIVVADPQHVFVTTPSHGSFLSGDNGHTFAPLAGAPQLSCLGKSPSGTLIGCGANWDPDFMAIASSIDVGASWQQVWRFAQLDGALKCSAGTTEHDECDAVEWTTLSKQFGATGPVCGANVWPSEPPPPPPRGCCDGSGAAPSCVWVLVVVFAMRRRR